MFVVDRRYILSIDLFVINVGGELIGWNFIVVVKFVIVDELGKISVDGGG